MFNIKPLFQLNLMSMKLSKFLTTILALSLPVYLLIGGCDRDDLDQAEAFGKLSEKFQGSTSKLSRDIFDSCMRRVNYYPIDSRIEGVNLKEEETKNCYKFNQPLAEKAEFSSRILVNYMNSIYKLSSNDTVNFQASLTDVGTALKGLIKSDGTSLLNADHVNAGVNIFGFLLNLGKQDYQRRQLKQIIPCTDPALQTYSEGLKSVFQEGYIDELLALEQKQMLNYYETIAENLKAEGAGINGVMAMDKEYMTQLTAFLDRRDAALAYLEVLDETKNAHADLAKVFGKEEQDINSASFQKQCQQYLAQDSTAKANLKNRVSEENTEITLEEWQKVRDISTRYQQKVTPLLEKIEGAFSE